MGSYFRSELEHWLRKKNTAGKILDVGGSQLPVENRVKNVGDGSEVWTLDLAVPHEEKKKPNIVFDISDKDISKCEKLKGYFDNVFCLEVMEYVIDPVTTIKNLNFFLRKGGLLYISFPFLYPLHKPSSKDYLRYTIYGAEKLLEIGGFQVKEHDLRRVADQEKYFAFINGEGYKYDRTEDVLRLSATGSLIIAEKMNEYEV